MLGKIREEEKISFYSETKIKAYLYLKLKIYCK